MKALLARTASDAPPTGATLLIYHRVGGGSREELDVPADRFAAQLDALPPGSVVSLDTAVGRLRQGDSTASTVLTFDDGFADVHTNAWPELKARGLPFTLYLTSGCVAGRMTWTGSTARTTGAPALTWDQIAEMAGTGLCTVANHTRSHARPSGLTCAELDACSDDIERHLGTRPRHFAYTWGVPVPHMEPALRERFLSAATGRVGRNAPGCDPIRLRRVPVRRTDPMGFFGAKLAGGLWPERAYGRIVGAAKAVGAGG
ncbi:polysaccharide deacetylase family protein [Wenjunlia tyrosinilytica]|uniref:polysaccharide deacetylase family protein n=1 Tax=Wenjunlia tyrosinilytica TaxID=1544741 RepID=UPI001E2E6909|nr:polysaccharide deacetylase family protein [Wenjunlia tyrosinilytica]